MKNCMLLLLWMVGMCTCTMAQQPGESEGTNSFLPPLATSKHTFSPIFPKQFSPKEINRDTLKTFSYAPAYHLRKSRQQHIHGIVLIAGGSMMSALGIRYGMRGGYIVMDNTAHAGENKYERNSFTRLALTGLVMMAGSIPYFVAALKNKKVAGLKLTCQKTSFGASNKARKKVTGLTFCIPLGK